MLNLFSRKIRLGFAGLLLCPSSLLAAAPVRDGVRPEAAVQSGVPPGQFIVAVVAVLLVVACVLLHYEVLRKLSLLLNRLQQLHRMRVLVLILGLLMTHVVEVWIYAFGYWVLDGHALFGHLEGRIHHQWLDHIYFSFVTFTTIGYGDIVPVGPIRFIAAMEALNGWVLLGWSASFTFLEMQRFWREPKT